MEPASQFFSAQRYSAKKMLKPVNFVCLAPDAISVSLVGDFNEWDMQAHPMRRQPDGAWLLQVPLHHGHHQYRFVVDGEPQLDPHASGVTRNHAGERVSLLAVS
jgi:1,4-alpha-glucan branching enzyme